MELFLFRDKFALDYTLGKLAIDNALECDTCEDTDRFLEDNPSAKIPGKTCIPRGRYKVIRDFSNRFQKHMLHVLDVPGFEGIRIHAGNSELDVEGCIAVGRKRSSEGSLRILESKAALEAVEDKIVTALDAGDEVWLNVH